MSLMGIRSTAASGLWSITGDSIVMQQRYGDAVREFEFDDHDSFVRAYNCMVENLR